MTSCALRGCGDQLWDARIPRTVASTGHRRSWYSGDSIWHATEGGEGGRSVADSHGQTPVVAHAGHRQGAGLGVGPELRWERATCWKGSAVTGLALCSEATDMVYTPVL